MKKNFILILSLLMVLGLCSSAMAVPSPMGWNQSQVNSFIGNNYEDYREIPGALGDKSKKPTAQFSVQVGNQTATSPAFDDLSVPTPSIQMSEGQSAIINNLSSPTDGTNRKITIYDFQYRIVPEGTDRKSQPIVPSFEGSWSGVQKQFSKAISEMQELGVNAELELYLCVADGSGGDNWSSNGNVASDRAADGIFGPMMWYFSGMVIEYSVGGPDFSPLPEGATEYQESFKVNAKTYTAEPGTALNIPVRVINSSVTGTTDLAATWFGTGWSNPVFTQKDITIPQGGYQEFTIPVTVPQSGQETRLVVCTNVDGNTPANEINKDNNMMIITITPPGVDLAVEVTPAQPSYKIGTRDGMVTILANVKVTRLDAGTEPVRATLTLESPKNTFSMDVILMPGETEYHQTGCGIDVAGTYTLGAQIWPKDIPDTSPGNNTDTCKITVTKQVNATTGPTEGGIYGGLTG